ncbi:WD40-repeat-containing domain protein [Lipomyces oligophaga]|uniref:WD40-repeat-containing domain protein n=1 Tax=Lipomyces oligophaga TaxID=45792 RepID=UPI0034CD3E5F
MDDGDIVMDRSEEDDDLIDRRESYGDPEPDDQDQDQDPDQDQDGEGDQDGEAEVDQDQDQDGDVDMDATADGEEEDDDDEEADEVEPDGDIDAEQDDELTQTQTRTQTETNHNTLSAPVWLYSYAHSRQFSTSRLLSGFDTCPSYDIAPYVAAPMSTSINCVDLPQSMRWIFTGGQDGFIRKFDFFASINGKLALTVAQKHPFADSITKASVLLSYWENEIPYEYPPDEAITGQDQLPDMKTSPVYAMAVQSQSLWLLAGLETGGITLQSIRHGEGRIHAHLKRHTSAVSVLRLNHDETLVISGGWDKNIYEWDLNTGSIAREFSGSTGQISAIAWRPEGANTVAIQPNRNHNDMVIGNGFNKELQAATEKLNTLSGPATAGEDSDLGSLFGEDDDEETDSKPAISSSLMDHDVVSAQSLPGSFPLDHESPTPAPIYEQENQPLLSQPSTLIPIPHQSSPTRETSPSSSHPTSIKPSSEHESSLSSQKSTTVTNGITNGSNDTHDISSSPSSPSPITNSDARTSLSNNIFAAVSIDGKAKIWDRRAPSCIAEIPLQHGIPPWCMSACWSLDGNSLYFGRRNGIVEEYSFHSSFAKPTRSLKLPADSGPVSCVTPMPNGRHIVCASYDNIRLYDLQASSSSSSSFTNSSVTSKVPFLIIPGHHGGMISDILIDQTGKYMISTGGNRGWEGIPTEVMLIYEIEKIV